MSEFNPVELSTPKKESTPDEVNELLLQLHGLAIKYNFKTPDGHSDTVALAVACNNKTAPEEACHAYEQLGARLQDAAEKLAKRSKRNDEEIKMAA